MIDEAGAPVREAEDIVATDTDFQRGEGDRPVDVILRHELNIGGTEFQIEIHRLNEDRVDAAFLVDRPDEVLRFGKRGVAEIRQRRLEVIRRDREMLGDDRDGSFLIGIEIIHRAIDRAQELHIFVRVGLELAGMRHHDVEDQVLLVP